MDLVQRRHERHLMRQRGAGLPQLSNVSFGFNFNPSAKLAAALSPKQHQQQTIGLSKTPIQKAKKQKLLGGLRSTARRKKPAKQDDPPTAKTQDAAKVGNECSASNMVSGVGPRLDVPSSMMQTTYREQEAEPVNTGKRKRPNVLDHKSRKRPELLSQIEISALDAIGKESGADKLRERADQMKTTEGRDSKDRNGLKGDALETTKGRVRSKVDAEDCTSHIATRTKKQRAKAGKSYKEIVVDISPIRSDSAQEAKASRRADSQRKKRRKSIEAQILPIEDPKPEKPKARRGRPRKNLEIEDEVAKRGINSTTADTILPLTNDRRQTCVDRVSVLPKARGQRSELRRDDECRQEPTAGHDKSGQELGGGRLRLDRQTDCCVKRPDIQPGKVSSELGRTGQGRSEQGKPIITAARTATDMGRGKRNESPTLAPKLATILQSNHQYNSKTHSHAPGKKRSLSTLHSLKDEKENTESTVAPKGRSRHLQLADLLAGDAEWGHL